MYDVCVIGLGYVGLPTAALFAAAGERVFGVDTNKDLLTALDKGSWKSSEADLRELVRTVVSKKFLTVGEKPVLAKAFIICVPTPERDGEADLTALDNAVRAVAETIKQTAAELVVIESTVPPHTAENHVCPIFKEFGVDPGRDFHLAYCPERVLPGNTIHEITQNHRTIGGLTKECGQAAAALYRRISSGPISATSILTAELSKLVENSYRLVNVALANEVFDMCVRHGALPEAVISAANCHPRVHLLRPGAGVGGHCIPVDPHFLSPAEGSLIARSLYLSQMRPMQIAMKIMEATETGDKIALLGLTYKANTDDCRNSPAKEVLRIMASHVREVTVFDPHAARPTDAPEWRENLQDAAEQAALVVVLVDHSKFRSLNPQEMAELVAGKKVFDVAGALNRISWKACGFQFIL